MPVTVTLAEPVDSTPASWQSLAMHISGQTVQTYHLSQTGTWTLTGGGGQNTPVTITASGGDQPQ